MSEEKQGLLALKENASLIKEQAALTGGALLVSGIFDVATHFDGFCVFAGLAGAFLAYRHGSDVLDHLRPGRHNAQAMEATAHFVEAVASQREEDGVLDESVPAKLRRLFGMRTQLSAHPKDTDQSCAIEQPEQEEVTQANKPVEQEEDDVMEDLQPKPQPVESLLPRRSPTFAQMKHLITPGRDILAYDGQEFIIAESLKQTVNFAMIGVPHSGKTTGLAFHAAQALVRGAIVRGWDLHGDVAADLGGILHILEDVDEIVDDCEWIQAERERRLALRKRARAGEREAVQRWNETRELFYIVDEFNALMLRLKKRKEDKELVADTLLSLIAEGRKFKMRVILTGQTMPAALFGDQGSSARDIINTKYALQSREDHAQYFGIEAKAIRTLLPLISGNDSAGYAVLDGGPLMHAKLVSIPLTTVEDIRAIVGARGGMESEEEDDLMEYMMNRRRSRHEEEERHTDELPTTPRRHVATSAYEQHRQRIEARKRPVYAERAVRATIQEQEKKQTELDLALEAWDAGNTTVDTLALALNKTPWTVRPLYAQVKKMRGK